MLICRLLSGAGAGTVAIGGSVSINSISTTIDSFIAGGALVTADEDVNVVATDSSEIKTITGAANGAGTVAIGAAISTNNIDSTINSRIEGAGTTVTATSGYVNVEAIATLNIKSLAAGLSGSGTVAITGSVTLNDMGAKTNAFIGTGATIKLQVE